MQEPWFYAAWLVGAFLLGSASWGDIVSRATGVNIRAAGDGNPGARNIWKHGGPKFSVAVLALDVLTGVAATLPLLFLDFPDWLKLAATAAVLAGHMFSPFLRFRGGVGGAIAIGAMFGLLPLGALVGAAVAGLTIVWSRTAIYAVWGFFFPVLIAGVLLHRDYEAASAALLAIVMTSVKWAVQYRIRSVADVRRWMEG